ncbi:MAG: EamA family transporter, partial [Acidimicrobiaceae bacterium]|nr:EamA family transporter [Acidimicrobiaceae bacterium]
MSAFGMDGNSHNETRAGLVSGSAAYLIWGALTIFWKLLDDFDAFELIGWRIVTALVLLLAVVAFQKNLRGVFAALRNPRLLARVAAASLLLVTNWTLYVWAVVNERIIETALGYFIAPIGTTLVGVLVLGEKLRSVQRAALVLAFASVAVITITYGRPPLLALAIAASWVIYGLLKKQVPLRP